MRDWEKKQKEYEERMARVKELKLRLTCTICGEKAKLNCPCGTTSYCSVACQKIDWRDRGHRKACKKIRNERAEEEKRAEAPTPEPPPKEIFYGPAPRSHADEVRARIAAEHEAARLRREANPEPKPASERFGSRCPICMEEWDVNNATTILPCCCRIICTQCAPKISDQPCVICHRVPLRTNSEVLVVIRRHIEQEVPEAITHLAESYRDGALGLVKSMKKAAKLYKRAVELGDVSAMLGLGLFYASGQGVKLDMKKARQLWQMGADRGCAHSHYNLGLILRKEGNHDDAFRLFQIAADQGYTDAEEVIGRCYSMGEGVEVNFAEAKRWWERAAAKGDEHATRNLLVLRNSS